MTGQPNARQPRSGQAVKTASSKAARQLAFAALRAEAMTARGSAFALLAMQFGQKLAAAQQQLTGAALATALKAIMAEQRAAERALSVRLKAEDAARRKAVGKEFNAKDRGSQAVAYRAAAAETTSRRHGQPDRPRDRARGTRTPKLRR